MKRSEVLQNLVNNIELERFRNLPVTEKFKLLEYIKLIYTEAEFAAREGVLQLENSPNYTINSTYNLFAMLIVKLNDYDLLKEIMINYAKNFENSDIYYAQITITGMGLLMIEKQFHPKAIYHFLLNLLGVDFLVENLKTTAHVNEVKHTDFKLDSTIKYKPFEGEKRRIKYELLALLKIRHEQGLDAVSDIINNKYNNKRLQFYFNMLNNKSDSTSAYLYEDFMATDSQTNRLLAAGAYAMLQEKSIISAHYLFNSIIGKYSRFDKRKEEIDQEIMERLNEII
ncbi:MAG: hypothetical protein JXR88_09185 [Clostridia bacterium]|nr:hypothetical protein [Clostridia bacterium]